MMGKLDRYMQKKLDHQIIPHKNKLKMSNTLKYVSQPQKS